MNERLMKATLTLSDRVGVRADEGRKTTARDTRAIADDIARESQLSDRERDDLRAAATRFADPKSAIPRWTYAALALAVAAAIAIVLWPRDRVHRFQGVVIGGPPPSALREVPRIPCDAAAPAVMEKRLVECSGSVTTVRAEPTSIELRARSARYRFERTALEPDGMCTWRVEVVVEDAADVASAKTCLAAFGARQ